MSLQSGNIAVGGVFDGNAAMPRKRCGDKLKVAFGAKKKRRAGPILSLLESADCSLLSMEESASTSPPEERCLLLAKHDGKFTRIRLLAKFVKYAPLAVGDEVMFNFPDDASEPSGMQAVITPNTVAVIQRYCAHATDEALSEYTVRVCLPGAELSVAVFTVLRRHVYYIKRCPGLVMRPS